MFSKKLLESEVIRYIALGNDVIQDLDTTLSHLHTGERLAIITTDNHQQQNQIILDQIPKLEQEQRNTLSLSVQINEEKTNSYIDELEKFQPDTFIFFGDAKTIDFGKYLTLHYQKRVNMDFNKISWISVPTTPESDSISSPFIFLDVNGKGEQYLGKVPPPLAILADKSILSDISDRYLCAGIADLFSRQTAVWDWKLANRVKGHAISDFVAEISSQTLNILTKQLQGMHVSHEEAISVVMKAQIIAGFLSGFANDIRSCYGSEHMFAQALDHQEPGKSLHGERVALGTIMMARLQGQDWKKIKACLNQFNIPIQATSLGYKTTSVIKALIQAVNFPKDEELYTILGSGLTEEAAWNLAIRTGVIHGL